MRTVVKRTAAVVENAKNDGTDKAPMPGGSSGQPDDPNPRSTLIHGIDDVAPATTLDSRPNVAAKRFKVTGGPEKVMYGGQSVRVIMGKIFTDASTDLDLLRRQGVQFEELTGEVAA